MKKVFKSAVLASFAAAGLTLAACDGPAENAAEDVGEMNAEVVDEQVEAAEDAGQITEGQEDAMTEQAEEQADAMEEQGEAIDNAQ